MLLSYFIEKESDELKKKPPFVPKELPALLKTYHFPGNIRELRSIVINALAEHKSKVLSLRYFEEYINEKTKSKTISLSETEEKISYSGSFPTLKEAKYFLICKAMELPKK